MRVRVDAGKCVGAGSCALVAPDVFDQDDDDGTVILLHEAVPAGHEDQVREAAAICPAGVIALNHTGG
ncbi:ferredoxin [Acrocarpospora macrocephala]|uniref:Ferredoxin n=1 Tax=Acrocarpospora macrocephala TaxID=150177 RepID=A0A5M3WLS0_9ACTN|nr:ferredoxin [Acrocarpospora macrocephala]GES09586.1 ferredoxin [Acrocarpospora macrocephala]